MEKAWIEEEEEEEEEKVRGDGGQARLLPVILCHSHGALSL